MEIAHPLERPSTAVNVTVRTTRPREYLTEREIERLMADFATNSSRRGTSAAPR